jgi:RNA polymerase sigma-B factor
MTKLAEPTMIIATAPDLAEPTTPPSHPGRCATAVHTVAASGHSQPVDAPATTEQLLCRLGNLPAEHPDRAALRARIIEKNLPLAHRLARRYAGRGELLDDLTQVAALALIKAVDSYDPKRQNPFTSYAGPSVLGALKRHFRDIVWGMRVPRRAQELAHEVAIATEELSQRRGRSPTPTELADHLHVSAAEVLIAIGASRAYHPLSLNAPDAGTGGADLVEFIGAIDPRYTRVDDRLALPLLRPLLAALPAQERRILTMRFFGEMSQRQIAAEMGLSQMQVSRLLKRSLTRIRAGLLS